MDQLQQQIVLLFSIPIYAAIIPLEILLSNFRRLNFYSWKETAVNIYLNLLNAGIDLLLRAYIGLTVLWFFSQYTLSIDWNPVVYWVVLLFAEDLLFWVEHFVDHSVRFFWAVHVTHHSSPEYNLSTGFRSSVLMPVYKYLYFIPLVLLHFKPMDVVFMYSITQIYGILVHTQAVKKLPGWIEYVFVTPSHHRVHHASNIPYLDKNMGMVFIFWDRLFGTFTEEMPNEQPHYGITKPIDSPFHPVRIVTHEWHEIVKDMKKSKSWKDKLNYLLRPPGWSHDGSTQTSKELQRDWEPQNIKMIRTLLCIALATLAACGGRPECTNHNPILDQNGYTTPQYKDELLKQIRNTDPAKLHYWIESYKETDGKPFMLLNVQSDNLCAQMLVDIKNPNKMNQFKNVKGVSYRGVEITGFQYMTDTANGHYNFVFEEGKIKGKKQ